MGDAVLCYNAGMPIPNGHYWVKDRTASRDEWVIAKVDDGIAWVIGSDAPVELSDLVGFLPIKPPEGAGPQAIQSATRTG